MCASVPGLAGQPGPLWNTRTLTALATALWLNLSSVALWRCPNTVNVLIHRHRTPGQ